MRRAVKIVKDKRLKKIPHGRENVEREIKILKRVNFPNVIKLMDVFRIESKEKLYMVFEYCVGSLQQMLDNAPNNRFPEFQAQQYFCQLIDGLGLSTFAG